MQLSAWPGAKQSRKVISVDDWCQVEKSDPSQGTSVEHFPNRA